MHGCAVFSAVVRSLFQALYGLRWRLIWYCVCVCCRFRLFSISFWIICTWSGLTTNSSFLSSYWWFALFFCAIPIPFFVCVCVSVYASIFLCILVINIFFFLSFLASKSSHFVLFLCSPFYIFFPPFGGFCVTLVQALTPHTSLICLFHLCSASANINNYI